MAGVIEVNGIERVLNVVPSTPDVRDYRFALEAPPAALQDTYDLSAGFTYDQGIQGSCTANAQAKIFRMLLKAQGLADFDISRAMIYFESRKLEGNTNQDAGSTLADSMRGLYLSGACSDATMHYRDTDYTTAPSQAAYREGQDHQCLAYGLVNQTADAIGAALDAKHPVSIGFVVYQNFNPDAGGLIPMPAGNALGGHNTVITGRYHSRRLYIIDNSWSERWGIAISGTAGRALVPYDFVHNPQITFEVKAISNVEGVIVPPPAPPTPPAPVNRRFHYDRFIRQDWLKYDDNGEEFIWTSSGRYN
jgi:hypothetical protein